MRGLKQFYDATEEDKVTVTSFTDAWIETIHCKSIWGFEASHLLQMRGLKLVAGLVKMQLGLSHLLQMRGLKLNLLHTSVDNSPSHLLQMRGLKPISSSLQQQKESHIFYRCVD